MVPLNVTGRPSTTVAVGKTHEEGAFHDGPVEKGTSALHRGG